MQTTTEKNKLIGYLILGEIKFYNLKNEHFEKKSPKSKKKKHKYFAFNEYLPQCRS